MCAVKAPLRVLHAPTAVGGHPGGLARAERELGLESTAISLLPHPFGHGVDEVLGRDGDGVVRQSVNRFRLLRRMRNADVVHFNFGEPVLPFVRRTITGPIATVARALAFRDLMLLHRLGTRIVVTFQGDDARQATVGGPLIRAVPERYTPDRDAARQRTIAAFDRYADAIFFLNPDLADVLPERARFLPYASVDPDEWALRPGDTALDPPVVVHAPSDSRVKGTDRIVEAVSQLEAEGVALRFELLQGASREAVRSALEKSTLVVDQLNAGWYGGFAVEAMALGKPVVAAMDLLGHPCLPPEFCREVPVVHASGETLADRLRSLLASREECERLGRAGRAFVERWHDPRKVARVVVDAYYGDGRTARTVKPDS
jgi:glycosyltransferase involved in cell wall biosynthesis